MFSLWLFVQTCLKQIETNGGIIHYFVEVKILFNKFVGGNSNENFTFCFESFEVFQQQKNGKATLFTSHLLTVVGDKLGWTFKC
jgi:hypothetical protein